MATPISSFLGFFLVSTTLLVFLSYSKMGFGFEERETSIAITISFIIILIPLKSALYYHQLLAALLSKVFNLSLL
jgi:hypothetical protein